MEESTFLESPCKSVLLRGNRLPVGDPRHRERAGELGDLIAQHRDRRLVLV